MRITVRNKHGTAQFANNAFTVLRAIRYASVSEWSLCPEVSIAAAQADAPQEKAKAKQRIAYANSRSSVLRKQKIERTVAMRYSVANIYVVTVTP